MDRRDSTRSLLALRKLTRAIGDIARAQMTEYLATFGPLFRPKMILGDYVEDGSKDSTRRSEKAFKELQALYDTIAATKPFNVPRELTRPLRLSGSGLEITPVDTPHVIPVGPDTRTITVRSPLTWTLTYAGYPPNRLPELLRAKLRTGEELGAFVVSYLLMHVVTTNSPELMRAFEALHFPITTTTLPETGPLPITRIGFEVPTYRPSDEVILESAEITGMDAFEEIVNVQALTDLRDPLKERLLDVARQHAPEMV